MDYHFRNLVFEGGGLKGLAYTGALEVLEEKGILQKIERVGGTSVGSITAVLLGLNYSNAEIRKIYRRLDLQKMLDGSWGIVRNMVRLYTRFGWYKGDYFQSWIGGLIAAKTGKADTTFAELGERGDCREMYFLGTNLATSGVEIFSPEHTPWMSIAAAVRISMSFPLVFAAKRLPSGDVCLDGGLLDNYPVKLFDQKKYIRKFGVEKTYYRETNAQLPDGRGPGDTYLYNQETLGFRLDSEQQIASFHGEAAPVHRKIESLPAYARQFVKTLMEVQSNQHLHSDDWQRTIYIDTLGVKSFDFRIDESLKDRLEESGRVNTGKYFAWYDQSGNHPANRPIPPNPVSMPAFERL
jgi:NTE family protein